jgi:hypothetical protein
METRNITQLANSTNTENGVSSVDAADHDAGRLADLLCESPALALDRILHTLSEAAVTRPGDEVAKLQLEVCHYAVQLRQELVRAQYELFVTKQQTADDVAATERMARELEEESRETSRLQAELSAHREHVEEMDALLAELDTEAE